MNSGISDLEAIASFIRETAAAEILPRFGALAAGDIREKAPGDLVTVADLEMERRLRLLLERHLPGSVTVGEESVAADPTRLALLTEPGPAWIIDPIDGTGNFAKGRPDFAVIVARVEAGETTAGWIYDPLTDVMAMAARGRGAWSQGRRLRVDASVPPQRMVGNAYGRAASGARAAQALIESGRIGAVRNRGSSGIEYLDIVSNVSQFTLHSRSLPWDHAAGMLIVAEAGGVARFLDASPYDARLHDRALLAAASIEGWSVVQEIVTARATGRGA
jgi:fructose-1,6-bisphosphatase/inositol monophosphatase family enzyme